MANTVPGEAISTPFLPRKKTPLPAFGMVLGRRSNSKPTFSTSLLVLVAVAVAVAVVVAVVVFIAAAVA